MIILIELGFDVTAYPGKPLQLPGVFLAAHLLAVDDVKVQDAHPVTGHGEHTALCIVEPRRIGNDIGSRIPADDGHAVVGLLAGVDDMIAGGLEGLGREVVIGQLGFLQAQHIGRIRSEPVEHLRQAHLQGIDIPGGDLHLRQVLRPL